MKCMLLLSFFVMPLSGCRGWSLDYGQPDAQFLQEDLSGFGKSFEGRHITVKGTVMKVDASQSEYVRVYLAEGIECNFGKLKAMAESCRIGDTVYVDGFLRRCNEGDVLIDPAVLRDPKAGFKAKKL